jgi:hypothetical protein
MERIVTVPTVRDMECEPGTGKRGWGVLCNASNLSTRLLLAPAYPYTLLAPMHPGKLSITYAALTQRGYYPEALNKANQVNKQVARVRARAYAVTRAEIVSGWRMPDTSCLAEPAGLGKQATQTKKSTPAPSSSNPPPPP